MPTQLVVTAGPDKDRAFPLNAGSSLIIGRGPTSQASLIDPHVSRAHCEIRWDAGQALLVDCKSVGGTFVNGERAENHRLRAGDVIRIGDTQLETTLPPSLAAIILKMLAKRPEDRFQTAAELLAELETAR